MIDLQTAEVEVRLAVGFDVAAIGARRLQEPFPVRTRVREGDVRARRHDHALDVRRRLNERLSAKNLLGVPISLLNYAVLLSAEWQGECGGQRYDVRKAGHRMAPGGRVSAVVT